MSIQNIDEAHVFKPLNFSKREIRLLRLGPSASHDSRVVCRFDVVTLGSRPKFEALSWCWGNLEESEPITLEGREWYTPSNLVEALRHLRYPDKERRLWVDALCINQRNYREALREKGQQIQLMKYIYSLSTTTVIWMGAPPEEMANFLLASLVDGQTLEQGLRADPEDTIGHLISLLLLPWWRRVWVVQEAVLAQKPQFQFGHLNLPMEHLLTQFQDFENHLDYPIQGTEAYEILKLLMQETISVFTHLLGSFRGLPALHRQALALAQMGRYQSNIVASRAKPFYDLMEVLAQCRYFQTTDTRDKIWGFLGLCTDAVSQRLDPGYELPVDKVYIDTTRKLIQNSGSLYILSQCQPDKASLKSLPSWVPDWTLPRVDGDAHEWNFGPSREDREYIHDASFGQSARNPEAGWSPEECKHVEQDDIDNVLPLQGLRYLWVDQLYHELGPCINMFDWWTKTRAWRNAYKSSRDIKAPSSGSSGGGGIFDKFRSEKTKEQMRKKDKGEYEYHMYIYWDLMMQGTMPRSWKPGMYVSIPAGAHLSESESEDDDDEPVVSALNRYGSIKHRFGEMVDGQVVCVTQEVLQECQRWGDAMDEGESYKPDFNLDEWFAHLQKTTVGRRFFLCAEWHFLSNVQAGLGPASLQRFDDIWVLAGGSHPFALRAKGRKPLNPNTSLTGDKAKYQDMRFTLVGELHLSGALSNGPMDGSIVEAASGDSDESHWMPQRRSNAIWWPPDIHLSKKRINLNDYWWTVWLY